jgi:predicted metal-dependent HD superfamily phosphohydrolase
MAGYTTLRCKKPEGRVFSGAAEPRVSRISAFKVRPFVIGFRGLERLLITETADTIAPKLPTTNCRLLDNHPYLAHHVGLELLHPCIAGAVTLVDRWDGDWADLGTPPPDARTLAELLARYTEPQRAYHTLQHLAECFAALDSSRGLAERPGEVAIALWFHDAIYDSHTSDNEARSAAWAEAVVSAAGGGREVGSRVRDLILATRHLEASGPGDQALLVDIDLAILGADADRFEEYEAQIRREYAWVPETAYRAERARLLAGFLARPRIYTTSYFSERLEGRARANLRQSIIGLGG